MNFGIYYENNNYNLAFYISLDENNIKLITVPRVTRTDTGIYDKENNKVILKRLGEGHIRENKIEFKNIILHRDNRVNKTYIPKKTLIQVGSHIMSDIENYVEEYSEGLFIEANPDKMKELNMYLDICNSKYNTRFIGLNYLVADKIGHDYNFCVNNCEGQSSSIFELNSELIKENKKHPTIRKWKGLKTEYNIKLKSEILKNIIEKHNYNNKKFDLILDVQGAELLVLKGIDKYINNIHKLTTEVSQKEYYKNGVLYDELHNYLIQHNFVTNRMDIPEHGDVIYYSNNK